MMTKEQKEKKVDDLQAHIHKALGEAFESKRPQWILVSLDSIPEDNVESSQGLIIGGASLHGLMRLTKQLRKHTVEALVRDVLKDKENPFAQGLIESALRMAMQKQVIEDDKDVISVVHDWSTKDA